jgi:hypothetical protein
MEASDVQVPLRRCGIVVHHAARMPMTVDGRHSVVVFLEATLGQFELARQCALGLPGVTDVYFSGHNQAVMYVLAAPSGADGPGRSALDRRRLRALRPRQARR